MGLLQGVQEVVITANDDFVVKDVDNKVNYKFKKMNEVNIRQKIELFMSIKKVRKLLL